MKKRNVLNLIRYYSEKNDIAFRNEAYEIARDFDFNGDHELSAYIMSLLSDVNVFYPQIEESDMSFLQKVDTSPTPLFLPEAILDDFKGVCNAISHSIGINKFMFAGAPGSGKTEAVKHLARMLKRDLYQVEFSYLIDSKLGQTAKNILELFKQLNGIKNPKKVLILFDELDALALDRTNSNDLREMGRVTSTLLKCLDSLNENIDVIATTNLQDHFDEAVLRRFDSIIDFNRYSEDELVEIGEKLLDIYLDKYKIGARDIRLFRKILKQAESLPYPGELKNILKSSIAFSSEENDKEYLRRIYQKLNNGKSVDVFSLSSQDFTVREIEILTGKSKSSVGRTLKEKCRNE